MYGRSIALIGSKRVTNVAVRTFVNSGTSSSGSAASVGKSTPSKSSSTADVPKTLTSYSKTLDTSLKGKILGQRLHTDADSNPISTGEINWATSWYGLGMKPFDKEIQEKLVEKLDSKDIEIKPDGLLYLPEIKYRRILNKAFGAGGWGLVPRSDTIVTSNLVTREYGLICNGQLVSVARGEQDYFNENGIPTATEGCKSNALMRCCKDLGIGSELWDPVFIKKYKETSCMEKFVEHISTKKKKKIWLRKDRKVEYPYK